MEFAIFPPGTSVWFWTASLKEPVQLVIDSVCIWLNEREPSISYSFKINPERGVYGRTDSRDVFATRAEAEAYRTQWIVDFRKSLGYLDPTL
jgi:hypothetical protein